jgi:hypothetical protein
MEMFGRVLILRGIAASDFAANHAQPQMDPGVADLQALFTTLFVGVFEFNFIEMCAGFFHYLSLPSICHHYSRTEARRAEFA